MDIFIEQPDRAFLVAATFLVAFILVSRARKRPVWAFLIPILAWIAYGLWEISLPGKGMNIRIDLLLIYPVLFVLTIVGLFMARAKRPS
jgi:hypothetical protein